MGLLQVFRATIERAVAMASTIAGKRSVIGISSTNTAMDVRTADENDVEQLTWIWFDGWHDAHAAILPEALTRLRTWESFRDRLRTELQAVRVVDQQGVAAGFTMLRGAEVYQFYVAASARGTGAATALMQDAEAQIADRGVKIAWLACAVGNVRAARFYEKCGWRRVGTVTTGSETSEGLFPIQVWKYEKQLT